VDVWQHLFIERLRRFRIPNVPAIVSVSTVWTSVTMDVHSHLREVGDVHPEENALLNR